MIHKAICIVALTLAGCTMQPRTHPNIPIPTVNSIEHSKDTENPRSDKLFVFLSFSGGGARASAFSLGVLEQLSRTSIQFDGRKRRLVDEVDVISSVSGGSATAAYFGLFGERVFDDFVDEFLKRDISSRLTQQVLLPWNWLRLATADFDRTDLTTEYFEKNLFEGRTLGDFAASGGPTIIINATNLNDGTRFAFDRTHFDWICSDLDQFSVARAVTASASVPIVLSPTTLKNYAGTCNFTPSVRPSKMRDQSSGDRYLIQQSSVMDAYLDSESQPYIHLYDGTFSDNLGLRAAIDAVSDAGGTEALFNNTDLRNTQKVLFIVVNAQRTAEKSWAKRQKSPSAAAVVMSAASVPVSAYAFETVTLLRSKLKQWQADFARLRCQSTATTTTACDTFESHVVELGFNRIPDPDQRRYAHQIKTSASIDPNDVDFLRTMGGQLLLESPAYQAFIKDIETDAANE